jgi:RHS repeat-associated protein
MYLSWPNALRRIHPGAVLGLCAGLLALVWLCRAPPAQADVSPSGSYQTSVPITVPAFHDLEPHLTIAYDSGSGDGLLGVGWALAGLSEVQRSSPGQGAPRYNGTDQFFLDGVELVPCGPGVTSPSCAYPPPSAAGTTFISYATRSESYERIAFEPGPAGGRWHVWLKDGTHLIYTAADVSPAGPPDDLSSRWTLATEADTVGNTVQYHYTASGADQTFQAEQYLDAITYDGVQVKFYYEPRPDPQTYSTGRGLIAGRQRLKTIAVTVGGQPLRAYALQYTSPASGGPRSLLTEVRQYGTDGNVDVVGNICQTPRVVRCRAHDLPAVPLPPIRLRYQQPGAAGPWAGRFTLPPERGLGSAGQPPSLFNGETVGPAPVVVGYNLVATGDVDGDGRTDWIGVGFDQSQSATTMEVVVSTALADGVGRAVVQDTLFLPKDQEWLHEDPNLIPLQLFSSWTMDFNGDGRSDLMLAVGYRQIPEDGPVIFEKIELMPALSLGDGHYYLEPPIRTPMHVPWGYGLQSCRPGDLNGDGLADLACNFFTWDENARPVGSSLLTMISRGDGTFDSSVARLPFGDGVGFRPMAVADVNGDGRADLMFLDYRPADLEKLQPGDPTATLHYDLVTGLSHGGDASTFTYTRQQAPWTAGSGDVPPPDLIAADINGDGRPDYVALVHGPDGGNLTEILTARTQPAGPLVLHDQAVPDGLSSVPTIVTVGDANGDGKDDLLVASQHEPGRGTGCAAQPSYPDVMLTRVLSAGDGTFALPATWDNCRISREMSLPWNAQLRAQELYSADTNGDGLADFLIASNTGQPGVVVLRDDVSASAGLDTYRWLPADVTGDGRNDFVYVRPDGSSEEILTLLQQPGGEMVLRSWPFPAGILAPSGRPVARSWKIMDVNGDGRADLVYASCVRSGTACLLQVEALISTGDGSWTPWRPQSFIWPGTPPGSPRILPMDVNGDGRTDLVALSSDAGQDPSGAHQLIFTLLAQGNADAPFAQGPETEPPAVLGSHTAGWRAMDVNGDGRADLVRVDRSGSGLKVQTLFATGDGGWRLASSQVPAADSTWSGIPVSDTSNWRGMDVNGDGQADLVHIAVTSGRLQVHTLLSDGDGGWIQQAWPAAGDQAAGSLTAADADLLGDTTRWLVADTNGDGRADLVHVRQTPAGLRVDSLLAEGDGGWARQQPAVVADPGPGNRYSPSWWVSDVDGDGQSDLVRVDLGPPPGIPSGPVRRCGLLPCPATSPRPPPPDVLHVSELGSTLPRDLLTGVTSGLGATTGVSYAAAARYDVSRPQDGCDLPLGVTRQVVAATTVSDGQSAADEITGYAYSCPRWSSYHRSFLGWTDVSATTQAAVNRPAVSVEQRYQQTDQCLTQPAGTGYRDSSGNYVGTRQILAYNPPGARPPYNCTLLDQDQLDYGLSSAVLNAYTYYAYDAFGNVTDIFEHGAQAKPGDERTTGYAYQHATGPWIVGLPWQETLSEGIQPAGKLLRSTFFCYDGDNGSDTANCSGMPAKGLLTAEQQVDSQGLYVTSAYQYDAYGNLAAEQDPRRFGTASFFDPTYHLYPEAITNAVLQTTSLDWDTVLGQVTAVTDPNGARTGYGYDQFGRLTSVTQPGGGTIHLQYLDWGDPARQRVREYAGDGTSDGLWAEAYFDGLGRVYRVVKEGDAPGETFTQDTIYSDASDRVYEQSQWARSSAGQQLARFETFEYDEVGRTTRQTHPDGTSLQFRYDTDGTSTWVTTTNERGHDKTVRSDAYGRVTEVFERDQADAQAVIVTYTYDAAGDLLTITDPDGNVTTNTWDLLGDLRAVDDPDLGRRTYTYDLDGDLKTETDAQNRTLAYTYDPLDRPHTKTYPSGQQVTWAYDEPGHGAGQGQLTSVTDPSAAGCPQDHSEDLTYDLNGQVTSQTNCVAGRAYTMGFGYDQLGRPTQVTYPGSQTVSYTYGTAGQLASMPGYVSQFRHNAAGQVEQADYAKGTQASLTYDADRQWLRTSTLTRGATVLYDASYSYEPNGLVKSATSSTNSMNLSYTYDELDRLTRVSGDVNQTYHYDAAGNGGSAYTYPPQGPGGCPANGVPHPCPAPHAPRFDGKRTLLYDANGDLTAAIDLAGNKTTSIDWTDDHQPAVISDGNGTTTRYTYDGVGDRVSERSGDEYIRYYGPYLEYSSTRGLIKYYYAGSQLIARSEGGSTYWYQADQLDSTRLITNQAGQVSQRYDYAPFGASIATTGSSGNDRQFAGQRTDTGTGLIDMKARQYDPQSGHFISPDTVIPDPLNTQALNPYSYAYNSPASYTDPSGHDPDSADISDASDSSPFSDVPSISVNIESSPYATGDQPGGIGGPGGGGAQWQPPAWIFGGPPGSPSTINAQLNLTPGQLTSSSYNNMFYGNGCPDTCHKLAPGTAVHEMTHQEKIAYSIGLSSPTALFAVPVIAATAEVAGTSTFLDAAMTRIYLLAPRLFNFVLGVGAVASTPKGSSALSDVDQALESTLNQAVEDLPTLEVDAQKMPNIARNIESALEEGQPDVLTRTMDPDLIAANRAAACAGFCGPESPDEYPFASTFEGGAGARIESVPLQEQFIQGALLNNFYAKYQIGHGDMFRVIVTGLKP